MAETFHPFPGLPKELRLQIWEQALMEARPGRCIIIYKLRVVPLKQFISPLLLVNRESRACARAFYNFKLDVYAIPPLSDNRIKSLDKNKNWNRIPGIKRAVDGKIHGYTDQWVKYVFGERRENIDHRLDEYLEFDEEMWKSPDLMEEEHRKNDREEREYTDNLEEHWAEYVEECLRVFGANSAVAATPGQIKGAFYISPEHDVFINGYECGRHFYSDKASKMFGAELEQRPICHHISAELDAATRNRVTTLVQVRPSCCRYGRHCVFRRDREVHYEWQPLAYYRKNLNNLKQEAFPSVNPYFVLRSYSYEDTGLLKQLIEVDGPKLSKILEQWVTEGPFLSRNGRTKWSFKQTKGTTFSYLKPADWTRELMEHWRVSE